MTDRKEKPPRLPYPEHLATLLEYAEVADRLYMDALTLRYPGREYQMRARPLDQTPAVRAYGVEMQRAAEEWIEAHIQHFFRPGQEQKVNGLVTPGSSSGQGPCLVPIPEDPHAPVSGGSTNDPPSEEPAPVPGVG